MKRVSIWKRCTTQYFLNVQRVVTQNQSFLTDPFHKRARPTDFNVEEYEEFINMVSKVPRYNEPSGSHLLLSFDAVSKNIHNYLKKLIKCSSLFQLCYLCKARFSSYTSLKAHWNRLGAEVQVRIQLSSIKPDIIEIYRNTEQDHSFHYIFQNIILFHKKC